MPKKEPSKETPALHFLEKRLNDYVEQTKQTPSISLIDTNIRAIMNDYGLGIQNFKRLHNYFMDKYHMNLKGSFEEPARELTASEKAELLKEIDTSKPGWIQRAKDLTKRKKASPEPLKEDIEIIKEPIS